eukprot:jgi/Mesen1/99/ME1119049C07595
MEGGRRLNALFSAARSRLHGGCVSGGGARRVELPDGVLIDGHAVVAVKCLSQASKQGNKEFEAETRTLGNIRHRNLVQLLGMCAVPESAERWLLYNYVPGGSLETLLYNDVAEDGAAAADSISFRKDAAFHLWQSRKHIAVGAARGLKYLHHDTTPGIVHRDIKPANILVGPGLHVHVADFGLAKFVDPTMTHLSTAVLRGTIGYLAPEYAQMGRLTEKSDVYSFGVVLLQLLTGKKPTDPLIAEMGGLPRWSRVRQLAEVVDPRLSAHGAGTGAAGNMGGGAAGGDGMGEAGAWGDGGGP